jgi:hypothetical protein
MQYCTALQGASCDHPQQTPSSLWYKLAALTVTAKHKPHLLMGKGRWRCLILGAAAQHHKVL